MKVCNLENSVNLLECLLWQYDNAPRLQSLIQSMQDDLNTNTRDFWNDFYTNVFNLDTANSFGLTVWGILLGVERPKYTSSGQEYIYTDEMYKKYLKARSILYANNGSIYDMNKYFEFLFPNKPILVVDNLDMTIRVVFYYTPSNDELVLVNNPNFLPRPSGVKLEVAVIPPDKIFGFDGSTLSGFDQGTFFS